MSNPGGPFVVVAGTGSDEEERPMGQDNATVVRTIEEAWDQGKLDELDQYFAKD